MKTNGFNFEHLINYLEENLFIENHKSIWSCCQYRIKTNMIYKNRWRSASNDTFVRAFLWLLCCVSLREKCLHSEFFWSVFPRIWTEYLEIVPISLYSVKMQENLDQKISEYRHFSRNVWYDLCFCSLLNTSLYCNNIGSYTEKNDK